MGNNQFLPPLESIDFKKLRKEAKLTLREVEDITGFSNSYLSQLETGKIKSPSYNTVRALHTLYTNQIWAKNYNPPKDKNGYL